MRPSAEPLIAMFQDGHGEQGTWGRPAAARLGAQGTSLPPTLLQVRVESVDAQSDTPSDHRQEILVEASIAG